MSPESPESRKSREASKLLSPRKIAIIAAAAVVLAAGFLFLSKSGPFGSAHHSAAPAKQPSVCANEPPQFFPAKYLRDKPFPMSIDPNAKYHVVMVTSCGTLDFDLFASKSP